MSIIIKEIATRTGSTLITIYILNKTDHTTAIEISYVLWQYLKDL